LHDLGWDTYQEVQVNSYGSIADIVATRGAVTWVIETKLSFGLAVMEQAERWRRYSNRISIGIPWIKTSALGQSFLRTLGIGMLRVSKHATYPTEGWEYEVSEEIPAHTLHKHLIRSIRCSLKEEQRIFAEAGNCLGRRFSPFQATCLGVKNEVTRQPGITIKELLGRINHHYASPSSARQSIAKWAVAGKIAGVKADCQGKYIRLYPLE